MQINLNSDVVVDGICQVSGPQVTFALADAGQANVAIHVALSDGTHFAFPDGSSGGQTSGSTVLPPGDYTCVALVAAFTHGSFGDSYASTVRINGRLAASAHGTVAAGDDEDDGNRAFVLRVA